MPYQDDKDILLEYLLYHDIITGTVSASGDQKPNLSLTQIRKAANEINSINENWITINSTKSGLYCNIPGSYQPEVKIFLFSAGGFTKIEYEKPLTDDERIKLLVNMKNDTGGLHLSVKPIWEWDYDPRIKRIVESLIIDDYVVEGMGNKSEDKFELTSLGAKSALAGRLLPRPANQASTYHIEKLDNSGALALSGDVNQHLQDHAHVGNKIHAPEKEESNWKTKAWNFMKDNWLVLILATYIIIGVILKQIFHISIGL